MGYGRNDSTGCLWAVLIYTLVYIIPVFIGFVLNIYQNISFAYSVALISIMLAIITGVYATRCKTKLDKMVYDIQLKERQMAIDFLKKEKAITAEKEKYQHQIDAMRSVMANKKPFSFSASLYTDMVSCIFDDASDYLQKKKHPAVSTAYEIKSVLKKRFVEAEIKYKTINYKLEFLLQIFPDLKSYIEDEPSLTELTLYKGYDNLSENRDRARDYLTQEEWSNLSVSQRNQLAFERWKKRDKSKLTIGLLYEMYISYELRQKGHSVIEYGIKHGVSDLGRDIISQKDGYTYIYQCKNWSYNKEIHENVVCQLFGTVMEYKISHNTDKVKAILVSTTTPSPMAKEFARRLEIEIQIRPLGDFPMIKCNINGNNKIYHLPFDQQYWRTEISKPGEIYAFSVPEAESKGFRRAMRHSF